MRQSSTLHAMPGAYAPGNPRARNRVRPGSAVRWTAGLLLALLPAARAAGDEAPDTEEAAHGPMTLSAPDRDARELADETLLLDVPELDEIDLPPPEEFLIDLPDEPPARRPTPEAAIIRLRQGFAEIREGNHEVAERLFREALDLVPGEPMAQLGLSTALLSLHAYDEAESLLLALVEDYPEDHAVLNNLAWLYATARELRFRDGERALRYARKALLQNPSSHHIWSTLAEAHFVRGAYPQAVRAAEQALHFARAAEADESTIGERQRLLERARQAARAFEILD